MSEYKHYIRIDRTNIVIHGYSDAFEQPQQGDVQLAGEFGRHFQIQIMTDRGQFKYNLIDGVITERNQAELDTEWEHRPKPPPTIEDKISLMQAALDDLILGGGF